MSKTEEGTIHFEMSLEGINLKIDGGERFLTLEKLAEFNGIMRKKLEWLEEMKHLANRVDNWSEEKERDNQQHCLNTANKNDSHPLRTGWQTMYFFTSEELEGSGNNKGSKLLLEAFSKEYGKHTVIDDPEHSWSYFYAQKIDDIIAFEKFVIDNYAKPLLEEYR